MIDHPRREYCSVLCRRKQFKIWDDARAPAKRKKMQQEAWRMKVGLMILMGAKCSFCSNPDMRVLEFSHLDKNEKDHRIRR